MRSARPYFEEVQSMQQTNLSLRFQVDDGWKLLIGAQNPDSVERAVRRLITNDQIL